MFDYLTLVEARGKRKCILHQMIAVVFKWFRPDSHFTFCIAFHQNSVQLLLYAKQPLLGMGLSCYLVILTFSDHPVTIWYAYCLKIEMTHYISRYTNDLASTANISCSSMDFFSYENWHQLIYSSDIC